MTEEEARKIWGSFGFDLGHPSNLSVLDYDPGEGDRAEYLFLGTVNVEDALKRKERK